MKQLFSYIIIFTALLFDSCKSNPCVDPDSYGDASLCPTVYAPVCGCNDVTYQNSCYAEADGVQAYTGGPCL